MRQFLAVIVLSLPALVWAEDTPWVNLSGTEIDEALNGRVLEYGAQWQDFRASGRTLYFAGRESWGYWEVRGDQYCSMWPPSDLWACYDMARSGERLRFIGAAGDISEAQYKPLDE